MRKVIAAALPALALLAAPALAQQGGKADKPETPVTDKDVSATDVVTTPATDLNLKKDEIPALLLAAQQRPYVLRGLDTCRELGAAIVELDGLLGDDVDVPQEEGRRVKPGRVAQSVVGSLIPFRGIIREVSGANAHDRALQQAVIAGVARRSFLKGIGQGKGCRYPARSATLEIYNARMAALNGGQLNGGQLNGGQGANAAPAARTESRPSGNVRFVSQPVVQRTDR